MNQALLTSSNALYAFLGGLIPAIIWLWFWLKEDPHPEPQKVLARAFVAGAAVIPLAMLVEAFFCESGRLAGLIPDCTVYPFWLLALWAATEELFKFAAAYWAALKYRHFVEPIDAPMYLITAAISFAAMENSIFIFKILSTYQNTEISILTGQLRFLGAMLLHITTSGIVGISIAFSFFHREHRYRNVVGGLFTAALLHALFNFFILKTGGENVLNVFLFVWAAAIAFIFLLEKVKRLKPLTSHLFLNA